MIKQTLFLVTILGMFACSVNFYGYSETQWQNLSEEDKKKAKAKYEQIVIFRQNEQHDEKIERRKQQIVDFGSSLEHKF